MPRNVQQALVASVIILAVSFSIAFAFARPNSLQQAAAEVCRMVDAGAPEWELVAFAQDAADEMADDIHPVDVVSEADFTCGVPPGVYDADIGGPLDEDDQVWDDDVWEDRSLDEQYEEDWNPGGSAPGGVVPPGP